MKLQTPKEYSEWLVDLQVEGQSVYAWAIAEYIKSYANQRVIEELETIEAKFPYNCAIEDYGWIWVDLKNRIEELKQD